MRGDEAFDVTTPGSIRNEWPAGQHHFKDTEKLFRHLKVGLIAGMMECDQDFVG